MTPPSNKQTRKASDTSARERAAQIKAQNDREERRRKLAIRGGIGVLIIVAVAGLTLLVLNGTKGTTKMGALPNITPTGADSLPPWNAPADTASQVNLAGLSLLGTEMLAQHNHVHLDIYADGKPVTVPAYLGIQGGAQSTALSSLHTHDASGVIHMESVVGQRFTLDQIFNEWNVKMGANQLGGLKVGDGKTLTYYVNGKPITTDPAHLELTEHQEIAIVYGTPAENKTVTVPSSYKWTEGL